MEHEPKMIEQLLAPLHPNEGALVPLFQDNIDGGMLRDIAEADYGEGADECYVLLQTMLKTGVVGTLDYPLSEVLVLTSLSEPERSDWTGGHGPRGHWMRLFACASLARRASTAELDNWLVYFVSSAIHLGEPVAQAAAGLLAWRFLTYSGNRREDPPLLAFAILLLAVQFERMQDRGPWLKQIAEWVEEEESRAREKFNYPAASNWLLGLSHRGPNDMTGGTWRDLAQHILAPPTASHPREADEALRRLAALIAQT